MATQRPGRVQEALRQEISRIIQSEIKDPRIGFLTVTQVELTPDLRYAKIYFSVLGDDKDRELALKGLNSAKGYIKGLISDRIKLRFMPEISFRIDKSWEHTRNIDDVLKKIKKEKLNEGSDKGDK